MKKIRSKSKKGFTLVELIVVLVILAILAAMLVPALTGYIKRAREEKDYQFAATVLTAAQSAATYQYAQGKTSNITQITPTQAGSKPITVADLIGAGSGAPAWRCSFVVNSQGVIKSGDVVITRDGSDFTYSWNGNVWTASQKPAASQSATT